MRAIVLSIIALLVVGCGSSSTPADHDYHFASKVSPQAEAKIVKLFRPTGPLVWGPIERKAIHHEGHFLMMPTSTRIGEELWRDATVGKLTYRVSAGYEGSMPHLVTISVRDGTVHPDSEPAQKTVASFGVDPGLIAAYGSPAGFVKYGGDSFDLMSEYYETKDETRLSMTYEFRP